MKELEEEEAIKERIVTYEREQESQHPFYRSLIESTCRKIMPGYLVVWVRNVDATWWCPSCAKHDRGQQTRMENVHFLARGGHHETICYGCHETIVHSYDAFSCIDCKMTWLANKVQYDEDDTTALDVYDPERRE